MKNQLLLLLTAALLPALATAQLKIGIEGQPYPLHSAVNAGADATYTLQWYRNGVAIPGCTTQTCTVPATLAIGDSVKFVRKVTGVNCADSEGWSNELIVTFKCGNGYGTRIGTLCWADGNIDAAGAFAATPSNHGMFYQWNRNKAWSSSGADAAIGWNSAADESGTWTVTPLPCPTNWRLPTRLEYMALDTQSGGNGDRRDGVNTNGGTWAAANARGNTAAGRFYGTNHKTCSLPNNMSGCVFFPASGNRNNGSNGALINQGAVGHYWSGTGTQSGTTGYDFYFDSNSSFPANYHIKAHGFSVRCVQ